MAYLVRAINRENWPEPEDNIQICDLDADALNDLKTSENKLSTWYAEDETKIKEAILAYLGTMDKWVKRDMQEFIVINIDDITKAAITVIAEPNKTYIKDYDILHRDLAQLKYLDVEHLAGIFMNTLKFGELHVLSSQDIRKLFISAVKRGLISSSTNFENNHKKFKNYIKEIEDELAGTTINC